MVTTSGVGGGGGARGRRTDGRIGSVSRNVGKRKKKIRCRRRVAAGARSPTIATGDAETRRDLSTRARTPTRRRRREKCRQPPSSGRSLRGEHRLQWPNATFPASPSSAVSRRAQPIVAPAAAQTSIEILKNRLPEFLPPPLPPSLLVPPPSLSLPVLQTLRLPPPPLPVSLSSASRATAAASDDILGSATAPLRTIAAGMEAPRSTPTGGRRVSPTTRPRRRHNP